MIPYRIIFDGIDESDALRSVVQERIEKLELFYSRIIRCEVFLSIPHRHRRSGRLGQAHIHIHLPGKEIVVSRNADPNDSHKDIYLAVRDAFDSGERALEERARMMRKRHIQKARRARPPVDTAV